MTAQPPFSTRQLAVARSFSQLSAWRSKRDDRLLLEELRLIPKRCRRRSSPAFRGATWRVLTLTERLAVVELCTCHGAPVEQLRSSDRELIEFLSTEQPRNPA